MSNPVISNIDNRPKVLGPHTRKTEKTILQDASAVIPEMAVLGEIKVQITPASVTVSAISGTGNGTCVKDATAPVKQGAIPGAYKILCVGKPAAHQSHWEVLDPNGKLVAGFSIDATGGSYTFDNQIKFALTDGSTDFEVGAFFTFTIAAGSGKLKRSDSASIDGSEIPKYILVNSVDATGADVVREVVYDTAVSESSLAFTGSETLDTVVLGKKFREWLELNGIKLLSGSNLSGYDNQ